jgi:uncharacterized protein (DUF2235 family)
MPKNIVICCDGTGQTIRAAPAPSSADRGPRPAERTNVLRIFDLLVKDTPDQISCYDPGIGTIPGLDQELRPLRVLKNVRDEWLGTGLFGNLAEMYVYLMERWEPGDRIFLFGFSRGSFTVRALAGIIRCVGLLRRGHENLLPYARDVYENMEARHRGGPPDREASDAFAAEFRRFARPDEVRIAFLGVWDTVKAYGYFTPSGVPFVRNNAQVDLVRHAVAIDERRPPFQLTGWSDRVLRESKLTDAQIAKRVKEVWFCGDHSDVGGGHPDSLCDAFTKASFDWMLGEARRALLLVSMDRYESVTSWPLGSGAPATCVPHDYSRQGGGRFMWMLPRFELDNSHFPAKRELRCFAHTGMRDMMGHRFPDQVRRDAQQGQGVTVPATISIHESVRERQARGDYAPPNLAAVRAAEGQPPPDGVTIEWIRTDPCAYSTAPCPPD